MFDIGWSELVVIGIVALIAIGPKELPTVLRTIGHWTGKLRRMASEFQGQFQDAMREAEIADLKKQFDDAANAANSISNFDPVATTRKELESTYEGIAKEPESTDAKTAVDSADPMLPPPAVPDPVASPEIAPVTPEPPSPEPKAGEGRA